MKRVAMLCSVAASLLAASAASQATVLTFQGFVGIDIPSD